MMADGWLASQPAGWLVGIAKRLIYFLKEDAEDKHEAREEEVELFSLKALFDL